MPFSTFYNSFVLVFTWIPLVSVDGALPLIRAGKAAWGFADGREERTELGSKGQSRLPQERAQVLQRRRQGSASVAYAWLRNTASAVTVVVVQAVHYRLCTNKGPGL